MCENSLPSGGGRSLGVKIAGEGVVPGEYFLVCTKLDTFCNLTVQSANCTVLRAVVLTQYRRVTYGQTDGQNDGIAVASTALAMRALRRAVKTDNILKFKQHYLFTTLLLHTHVCVLVERITY